MNATSGTAVARQAQVDEREEKNGELLGGTRSVAFGGGAGGSISRPQTAGANTKLVKNQWDKITFSKSPSRKATFANGTD